MAFYKYTKFQNLMAYKTAVHLSAITPTTYHAKLHDPCTWNTAVK